MLRKLIRSGLAVIIAISMVIMPNSVADAKEAVNYESVIKQAQIKADILTSVYGVTSVQYALIDDGKIVVSGQSGKNSKDNSIALSNSSMYGIGSVSKMYTTVAVMQLVEKGKVKLDTPVVNYIPEFKMKDSRYKDITVRMLLNHSSGLMGSSFSSGLLFNDNDTVSMDHLLSTLATQKLKAAPGEFSVYCNDGFSLAQLVVEKVSGISFSDYIKTYIAKPLGIENTKTPLDEFSRDQLAKTYDTGKDALPAENINAIGAGGIYSTAEDVCHFADVFMDDGNSQLLSDTSLKAMENPEYLNGRWYQEEDSVLSYGLGWDSVKTYPFTQCKIKALVKGGDTAFYHANLIVLPEEGMAMAVLSSGGVSTYDQIFAQEILLKALLAKGSIDEMIADKTFQAPVKATMPANLADYSGYYAYTSGVMKIDISKDGTLKLYTSESVSALSAQKFIYTGDNKFYYQDGSAYVSFKKESNGNTYIYVCSYSNLPNIGQTVSSGYQGQKLTANPISKEVKAAWEKRNNKTYFAANEKYSSIAYYLELPSLQETMLKNVEGYFVNAAITGANTAKISIQIPGAFGRDLSELNFYYIDKTEYMESCGSIFISEDAVKAFPTKTAKIKIGSDGYAKWYKLSSKLKNKQIKVTLPKNASFTVYDTNGVCVFNSWVTGETKATLPAGGYIVFAGDVGARFTVKYVK